MRALSIAAAFGLTASVVWAQDWGNIGPLMYQNLTTSGTAEASFWLPDTPDPATATVALGVVYEYIPGSAGNTDIAVGLFSRAGAGWSFAGEVAGIFGQSPSDPVFLASHAEVTTIMPGPNDARCCPTMPTRWRIDYQTLTAQQMN